MDRTKTWKVTEDINVCVLVTSKRGTDTDVRCECGSI